MKLSRTVSRPHAGMAWRRPASSHAVLAALLLCGSLLAMSAPSRLLAESPGAEASATEPYLLGPQDKVRLKIFAWRPSRDEVYEWKALNDVYTVGASGEVSLPLIGVVRAGGRSPGELSVAIGNRLRDVLRLVEAPTTSVEVIQFRPFYILGQVQHPGEFPFRPGLTVIQALSIAGGSYRVSELESIRLGRDVISTAGERRLLEGETWQLLAKRARLEAEVYERDDVEYPLVLQQNVRGAPEIGSLVNQENELFKSRRAQYATQIGQQQRMKALLEGEIQGLKSSIETQKKHVKAARDDARRVDELATRKLTTAGRQAEAQRRLGEAEAEQLRLNSSLVRAHQELARAEMATQELVANRKYQVTAELRSTQSRLDELGRRIETTDRLLGSGNPIQSSALTDGNDEDVLRFRIFRSHKGQTLELPATELTTVRPGDTIKVDRLRREVRRPEAAGATMPRTNPTTTLAARTTD